MGGETGGSSGGGKKSQELGMSPGRAKAQFGKSTLAGKTVGQAKDLTSGVAKTTAKQEEFSLPGSKFTGTTQISGYKTLGASPGDVNAIVGGYKSADYKSKLEGIAGITSKNLGDLQQRAQVGQLAEMAIDTPIGKIPASVASLGLNVIGKKMAQTIMDNIAAGQSAVFSTKGDIVGSVGKNALGMDVYTGQVGYNPIGRKSGVTRIGAGYKLGREMGPEGDGPDRATSSATGASEPTTSPSVPSTGLSGAAKKSLQAARASGAARRRFIV